MLTKCCVIGRSLFSPSQFPAPAEILLVNDRADLPDEIII